MRQHEREAFEQLYAEHVFRIYGFIAYRVSSAEAAQDLTQTVFEKALKAWARYDPNKASEQTWLFTIARNAMIDYFRQRREDLLADVDEQLAEPVDDRDLSSALSEALQSLQPRSRTVVALKYGGDLTGPEIAELLGLSTDNVHQILSRSLRDLRGQLESSGEPQSGESR